MKAPTLKQIAQAAGVSAGTVSHVLTGATKVRPALRERVEAAMAQLNYRPDLTGRALRQRRTSIVGMIIPDILNPFFPAVVRGVEDALFEAGQQLILCNSDNQLGKERAYLEVVQAYRLAGLIIIPTGTDDRDQRHAIEALPLPCVCIDRPPRWWANDSVASDNEEGGWLAAEHLIALGHRRLGLIMGPDSIAPAHLRARGFLRRVREAGLDEESVVLGKGAFDQASGYLAARGLLSVLPRPTAIFAANDLMAIGAISAVRARGLECPRDISVCGFDDLDIAQAVEPALTTISQDGRKLGDVAARMLLDRLNDPLSEPQHETLPVTIKIRKSTTQAPVI